MRQRRLFKFSNAVLPLIGINIFMFIIQSILGDGFTASFMLVSSDILARPWIILTHMFLHANLTHLFFNMYALLMFGSLIESKIGTKRFLTVYFLAGILAAIIPFYDAALGASGAIMGIIGIVIMLLPDLPVLLFFFIPMSMRTAGIIFALFDLFGAFLPLSTGIAHYAHLVGLMVGIIYGYYLLKTKKQFRKSFTSPHQKKKYSNVIDVDYNEVIEMDENDINEYLKNGRL